jgi:hypothetical protein
VFSKGNLVLTLCMLTALALTVASIGGGWFDGN